MDKELSAFILQGKISKTLLHQKVGEVELPWSTAVALIKGHLTIPPANNCKYYINIVFKILLWLL